MREKNQNRYMAGYMTVEATLIMPVVLYLCIFILYSGFYLYDRCVMKQDAFRAALKGSSAYGQDNEEAYRVAWDLLEKNTSDKYIATTGKYEISVRDTVKVNINGYVDIPFWNLAEMVGTNGFEIAETVECRDYNPALFIRMCRQLAEKAEKGVD